MQNEVRITLKYVGYFRESAQKAEELIDVDCDLEKAFGQVVEYLHCEYDLAPPYSATIDGKHITSAIKQAIVLRGGEVMSIVPHVSGG